MNVLLMNSYIPSKENKMIISGRCQIKKIPGIGIWPPIDLAQIAAIIRERAEKISILDFMIVNFSEENVYKKISMFGPDAIIVQTSTPTLKNDISFCSKIKHIIPKAKIIFFGIHASVRPQDIVSQEIEFAVRSEPEITIRELIESLKENRQDFQDIAGLSYWRDNALVNNSDRSYVQDLDSFPLPAREFIQNQAYILPYNKEPFTIIHVSRGCPYLCTFCTAGLYYGKQWRCRSPESIVAEIEEAVNKYKIRNFLFLSDTFNFQEDFVSQLCSLIRYKKLKIKWVCNSRVDKFNQKIAQEMKRAGCWLISIGIESAPNSILKAVRKNTTAQQTKEAIITARQAGIKILGYFIFGLPGENHQTVEETLSFIRQAKIDYGHFYTVTPFPGTEFYQQAKQNGWLISEDWGRYSHGTSDVISYPFFSHKDIQSAVTRAYRIFYLRPHIIWRELLNIKSFKQLVGFMEIGKGILQLIFTKEKNSSVLE